MKRFAKLWLPIIGLACLTAVSAGAAKPDNLLPSDADGVVVVNLRQILDSAVVKKYGLAQMQAAVAKDDKVAKSLAAAGIDPFKDVDTILFAGSANPGANKVLAVVRGRFDLDKINSTADDLAKKNDGKLKVLKEGDLRIFEVEGENSPVFLAFKDRKTLVASLSKEQTAEVASGKATGEPAKALQGALSKVSGKESMWAALVITRDMKKIMGKNPQTAGIAAKLEAVTATINLTDFLLATILIHTSDEKAATQVEMLVNQLKPLLAVLAQANEEAGPIVNELLANLKVAADKNAVSISLKVSEELVKKLNEKDKGDK